MCMFACKNVVFKNRQTLIAHYCCDQSSAIIHGSQLPSATHSVTSSPTSRTWAFLGSLLGRVIYNTMLERPEPFIILFGGFLVIFH